jgi:HTH-type transcriptional regulator / antitoxin HipB
MSEQRWVVRSSADLGRAISDIRHRRGLTQAELAREAGIGRSALSKLESGKSNRVLDHFLRLLRRLGATITVTFDTDTEERHDGQA